MKKIRYGVKGMSCAACVAHVEHAASSVCGEEAVNVSLLTNSITLTVEDSKGEDKLFRELQRALSAAGYGLLREESSHSARLQAERELKRNTVFLIISGILTLLLMVFAMGSMIGIPIPSILTSNGVVFGLCQLALALPVIILNFKFYRNGFLALFHRAPNMDSLIAIGSCASLLYGVAAVILMGYGYAVGNEALIHEYRHNLYFESAAMILTLVSLGKTLEGRAKANAARAVGDLAAMMPDTVHLLKEGVPVEMPLSAVEVGDLILIREGETVPVDGEVIEGIGSVDESAISGESIPVEKSAGSSVTAVCTLVSGSLTVRAHRVGKDTSLSKIISLIEDAAASKAPIARIADRVSGVFVPAVMVISLLTAVIWLIVTGDLSMALNCAVSVLVISCPCALGLATPTAVMVGISRGASLGILIKSSEALENLHGIRYILTDKTGTLTEGKPTVTELRVIGCTEEELLYGAYGAERGSSHPLASAICRAAEERLTALPSSSCCEGYFSSVGMGIGAKVDGKEVLVGKPEFLRRRGMDGDTLSSLEQEMKKLEEGGKTVVCVAMDGSPIGCIAISDPLRESSASSVAELKRMGITPVMLTGDNSRAALAIASECGIDPSHVHAGLLPQDKERLVREYSAKGSCAMVGDGINDAPALTAARVGIAVGAGTEVAVDSADVVLSKSAFRDILTAVDLSRATIRCIKQNLFWAMIYNMICIPVAAGVLYPFFGLTLSPMLGSAAMSFSSICVVGNSLRLRSARIYGDKSRAERRAEKRRSDDKLKAQTKENKKQKNNSETEQNDMFGKTKTVVFGVEGMMCKNCKAHVENALSAMKGVKSAEADLDAKSVTVVAKESVSDASLKEAVTKAGYKVTE